MYMLYITIVNIYILLRLLIYNTKITHLKSLLSRSLAFLQRVGDGRRGICRQRLNLHGLIQVVKIVSSLMKTTATGVYILKSTHHTIPRQQSRLFFSQ